MFAVAVSALVATFAPAALPFAVRAVAHYGPFVALPFVLTARAVEWLDELDAILGV